MTKVPSRARSIYTLRLAPAERQLLEAAAAERQEYLAEYVRQSALAAARRDVSGESETNGDHRRT